MTPCTHRLWITVHCRSQAVILLQAVSRSKISKPVPNYIQFNQLKWCPQIIHRFCHIVSLERRRATCPGAGKPVSHWHASHTVHSTSILGLQLVVWCSTVLYALACSEVSAALQCSISSKGQCCIGPPRFTGVERRTWVAPRVHVNQHHSPHLRPDPLTVASQVTSATNQCLPAWAWIPNVVDDTWQSHQGQCCFDGPRVRIRFTTSSLHPLLLSYQPRASEMYQIGRRKSLRGVCGTNNVGTNNVRNGQDLLLRLVKKVQTEVAVANQRYVQLSVGQCSTHALALWHCYTWCTRVSCQHLHCFIFHAAGVLISYDAIHLTQCVIDM